MTQIYSGAGSGTAPIAALYNTYYIYCNICNTYYHISLYVAIAAMYNIIRIQHQLPQYIIRYVLRIAAVGAVYVLYIGAVYVLYIGAVYDHILRTTAPTAAIYNTKCICNMSWLRCRCRRTHL